MNGVDNYKSSSFNRLKVQKEKTKVFRSPKQSALAVLIFWFRSQKLRKTATVPQTKTRDLDCLKTARIRLTYFTLSRLFQPHKVRSQVKMARKEA